MGQFPYAHLVLIFIFCWGVLSILIAKLSGWAKLSRHYRSDARPDGIFLYFSSAGMRFGTNYGGCLTVGVNKRGLYLAVWFLFRLGHPPLVIPWHDIAMTERKKFFIQQVVYRFAHCPDIPFIISKRLADKIAQVKENLLVA